MQVRSPLRAIAIMLRLWSHPLKTNELLVEEEQSALLLERDLDFHQEEWYRRFLPRWAGEPLALSTALSVHCSGIWGLTRRLKKEAVLVALSAELGLGLVPSLTPLSPNTCRLLFTSYPPLPVMQGVGLPLVLGSLSLSSVCFAPAAQSDWAGRKGTFSHTFGNLLLLCFEAYLLGCVSWRQREWVPSPIPTSVPKCRSVVTAPGTLEKFRITWGTCSSDSFRSLPTESSSYISGSLCF